MKWYLRVKNPFCATTQIWKNSSVNVLQKNNRNLLLKAIAVIRSGLFLYYTTLKPQIIFFSVKPSVAIAGGFILLISDATHYEPVLHHPFP